jgi:hypothetical protein
MEASGHARWFERLLRELQFDLWIGDAAEIRAKRVRKQKPIGRMRSGCCDSWWKIASRRSGYPTQPIETCGNGCGIDPDWVKAASITGRQPQGSPKERSFGQSPGRARYGGKGISQNGV